MFISNKFIRNENSINFRTVTNEYISREENILTVRSNETSEEFIVKRGTICNAWREKSRKKINYRRKGKAWVSHVSSFARDKRLGRPYLEILSVTIKPLVPRHSICQAKPPFFFFLSFFRALSTISPFSPPPMSREFSPPFFRFFSPFLRPS